MDVKVDVNKMRSTSKEYENCKNELENMMSNLKKSVASLNSVWIGGSKDKFVENEFSSLQSSMSKYIRKIEDLRSVLEYTAKQFSNLDNELK